MNTNQPLATGGTAQAAADARDAALVLLQLANARVRFFYCFASDDLDQTAELVKIGRQPRRDPGDAAAQPLPAAVGTVTFAAAALTAPALPDHATTLRAYRRAAGSAGFLCEAFDYLRQQIPKRTVAQDRALQERTFYPSRRRGT